MRRAVYTMRPAARIAAGLFITLLIAQLTGGTAIAKPLDAEACAQIKAQRDTLAATGVGELVRNRPPANRADISSERAKQVRTLIALDGQLRFRCGMDLLLPSLKPDPVEEFVDAGDTAGSGRPSPRAPAVKKPKAAKAAPAAPEPVGAPAPQTPRTAAIKTGTTTEPAAEPAAPKAAAKARSKADDAYRAPAGADPNGTPLDKQIPKPQ